MEGAGLYECEHLSTQTYVNLKKKLISSDKRKEPFDGRAANNRLLLQKKSQSWQNWGRSVKQWPDNVSDKISSFFAIRVANVCADLCYDCGH